MKDDNARVAGVIIILIGLGLLAIGERAEPIVYPHNVSTATVWPGR